MKGANSSVNTLLRVDISSKTFALRCSIEVMLSDPKPIGIRPNTIGAAMRDGPVYYLTEFNLGYSIIMFPSIRSLNHSEPKSLITLPYPFHGTDNTVYNGTIYYSYSGNTVIAFDMNTGDTKEMQLNASTTPLFNNSNSFVDVQADEHGIWVLYRRQAEEFLTARRVQPFSLKVLSTWSLSAIQPNLFCNALIRCGLLYMVKCDDKKVILSAAYDFYAHKYINGKKTEWEGINDLSNVQYDPRSKIITIFDSGVVYMVSAA
ncbi:Olfactomedin-like domain protein [Dictyocaulus viviparus]|uniref:Olfactomedin-like domain protein n=1 Tax=Dictyocaulus viviparus TaxID=29172 RepID=A0A0D8XVH2_DICVI|nr:Olfactomedin-like domain protein [Dictyocaulus viviparus]